jgi:hypothetical protein
VSDPDSMSEDRSGDHLVPLARPIKCLSAREVSMIDQMLTAVAPSGEVRLTIKKGRLRFISSTRSHQVKPRERNSD